MAYRDYFFWWTVARKLRKETIRNLKICKIMNVQHNIIEVIEETWFKWFGTFEEDTKWQNSKHDIGIDCRGQEEKEEDYWRMDGVRRTMISKELTEEDTHLSVPNVLFSFSILPCRSIPCWQFSSLSFQLLLPASMNFERSSVSSSSRWTTFQNLSR